MPELPEVETVVRSLRANFLDKKIASFVQKKVLLRSNHFDKKILFKKQIKSFSRNGKYIFVSFYDAEFEILIHLGMTGCIFVNKKEESFDELEKKYKHLVFSCKMTDESFFYFLDPRGFGQLFFLQNNVEIQKMKNKIAKDPFDSFWTTNTFGDLVQRSKMPIKKLLLDQQKISGIGNIYACEALFLTKLNPTKKANLISFQQASFLLDNIRDVLALGINNGGASVRDYKGPNQNNGNFQNLLNVYNQTNKKCKTNGCPEKITKFLQDGRSTFWCKICQN